MGVSSVRARVALALVALPVLYVGYQGAQTLDTLDRVERERDRWQRPEDVLRELDVRPGSTVVDFGSGAGYFALKIAPRVAPDGQVFAVDLRRESLAFLWIRARLRRLHNLNVILGATDDPRLPPVTVDAVLVANTFHELTAPDAVLDALARSMRSGARLVVVDREPRSTGEEAYASHEIAAADAARVISARGFAILRREDRFVDRASDDETWWLMTFRRL